MLTETENTPRHVDTVTLQVTQEIIDASFEATKDHGNFRLTRDCIVARTLTQHFGKETTCGYGGFYQNRQDYKLSKSAEAIARAFDEWYNGFCIQEDHPKIEPCEISFWPVN